jgi:hypothetical protein
MNISIRHLINILNHEGISLREKQEYLKKYQVNNKRRLSIHHRSEVFNNKIAEMIEKRLTNDLYVFYDHDENKLCVDDQEPELNDRGETISYYNYCDNYNSCSSCCETVYHEDIEYVHGDSFCPSCYSRQCYYCEECEEAQFNDDPCSCEDNRYPDEDTGLLSDQTEVELQYHGIDTSTEETMGLEIETEARSDYAVYDLVQEINDIFNKEKENLICVRDGSLDAEIGFEMVSTNATFDYHKNHFWNEFFKSDIPTKKLRAFKGSRTGIHIHFSRNAFNTHQLKHLNAFYHNPKNKSFLVDIAQRECTQYASYVPSINYFDDVEATGKKYRAINFSKSKTVEVRIFKSNVKPISFFRCLELVHSINQFIKTVEEHRTDSIDYTEYFDFLLNNPDERYVNLLLWLDQNEYFEHLQYIEDFRIRYANFKSIVEDFKENNQELIALESEDN